MSPDTTLYFSPDYLAAGRGFDTFQKAQWILDSLAKRPIAGVVLESPRPVIEDDLRAVHMPAYVDALRTGQPSLLSGSSGFEWEPGLWTALTASAGGIVDAALEALRRRRHAGSLSAGCHHARRDAGGSLCAVNGLALAVRTALDAGATRVLVLDVDAHPGDGTYDIVRDWPGVIHLDLATSSSGAYEVSPGTSSLDIVNTAADYVPTLERRLRALDGIPIDLVVAGLGVDCHQANAGPDGLDFAMLARREALIFGWAAERKVPVAFALLGGYRNEVLDEQALARLHRLAIAAAAMANSGEHVDEHDIMELASTQRGSEGFSFDATGHKSDADFHDEFLGDEDDDPFAYDLDLYVMLSPENQARFDEERERHPHSNRFLKELLREEGYEYRDEDDSAN
jgi:acetoin utilization deacetylase AcuC-like enzyme